MKYEIIKVDFMGIEQEHVLLDNENGSIESFPVDESNSRYQQFLAELEAEA